MSHNAMEMDNSTQLVLDIKKGPKFMYMSLKGRHAFSFHRAIKEMKPSPSKFLDKLYIVCLLTKTFFSSFSPPRICGVTGNLNLNKTELSLFSPKKPLIMGGNSKVLLNFQLWQRR